MCCAVAPWRKIGLGSEMYENDDMNCSTCVWSISPFGLLTSNINFIKNILGAGTCNIFLLRCAVTENLGISPKAGEILVVWFGFILTSLEMTLSYSYFMMTLNIHFKSWYWASKVTISIQYSLLTEIVSCVN